MTLIAKMIGIIFTKLIGVFTMQIELETTEVKIEKIAYHRNGVSGEPFFVINFTCIQVGEMVGIVFFKYNEEHDKYFLDMNPRGCSI